MRHSKTKVENRLDNVLVFVLKAVSLAGLGLVLYMGALVIFETLMGDFG